ncbi:MAG TPA: protein kinase [Blastocatellia bacterium]|nr:protein kinase [Blastocatellia bacterium]
MQTIANYEIVRELGRGGMGVVYEAIQKPLDRRVALKLLHPEWAARQDISARFLEEAKSVAKLNRPTIIEVYDFGQVNDTYYLALKYIDGPPLDAVLAQERLSIKRIVDVLIGVADALAHAHQVGIVHRDVKPGNIFLDKDGHVVLGDFGIAKALDPNLQALTQTGQVIGTPAYMSPEQAQGQPVTPASDLYSLGILAFELITGRVPFTADTAIALLMKHVYEPPPPILDLAPNVPQELAELIGYLLEKSPSQRPQTGKEVLLSLSSIQKKLELSEQPTDLLHPEKRRPEEGASYLDELEITLACFELVGFSRETCQNLLPARVAFLLESWYRLVRQAVYGSGGIVDRYVADRVTSIFGYPNRYMDHANRAMLAAKSLKKALSDFNKAHDLQLEMRAGIACGPALIGRIAGDVTTTSVQGILPGDMIVLSKTRSVEAPIRLNRAAYRRVSALASFSRFEESRVGEGWATFADEE